MRLLHAGEMEAFFRLFLQKILLLVSAFNLNLIAEAGMSFAAYSQVSRCSRGLRADRCCGVECSLLISGARRAVLLAVKLQAKRPALAPLSYMACDRSSSRHLTDPLHAGIGERAPVRSSVNQCSHCWQSR